MPVLRCFTVLAYYRSESIASLIFGNVFSLLIDGSRGDLPFESLEESRRFPEKNWCRRIYVSFEVNGEPERRFSGPRACPEALFMNPLLN